MCPFCDAEGMIFPKFARSDPRDIQEGVLTRAKCPRSPEKDCNLENITAWNCLNDRLGGAKVVVVGKTN